MIEEGMTVLDSNNRAWFVSKINPPEMIDIDGFDIGILTCEVTDGEETETKLIGEICQAKMTKIGEVLKRGYI